MATVETAVQKATDPITVAVAAPCELIQVVQQLMAALQGVDSCNAVRDEPRVRNAAAAILRGAYSFHVAGSTCFQSLGCAHPSVVQLAAAMEVSADELVDQADAVLDRRRNAAAHPGTLAGLDAEVAAVKELITDAHAQRYAWECRIVQRYEQVKAAFPDRFAACL